MGHTNEITMIPEQLDETNSGIKSDDSLAFAVRNKISAGHIAIGLSNNF